MTLIWDDTALKAKIKRAVKLGVARGVEAVHEEATSLILDGEKTGRVYRRRGVEHQASAPGQAPASDTGRLVQSGRTSVGTSAQLSVPAGDDLAATMVTALRKAEVADRGGAGEQIVGTVTWSTAYAPKLEHGTENTAPRPFARPALAAKRDEIVNDIADEVRRALK
ncbi:MAG: hypothetical protein RIB97_01020 [Nitratireductor sp.]